MKDHLTKYWMCFVHALLGAIIIVLPLASSTAAPARPKRDTDQIIVKPKPGRDLAATHARAKGRLKKKIRRADGDYDVVKLPPGVSTAQALAEYQAQPDVEFAEPDYILSANAVPNDPRYADGMLWSLHNTGQNGGQIDADIDAPEAWNLQATAANIIVAVVDTGVRFTHEDLAANMWRNPAEIPGNTLDDDGNGYADDVHGINTIDVSGYPMDDHGHGTHVAGTIAAVGNNGRGIAGVAWGAQIMALKFLDVNGEGYTSDAILAIDYARLKGAKIINASFAGEYSVALRDAIVRAQGAGIIVAAAAGNETADNDVVPSYPANYALDNVVSVAATTRSDALADYSNFGAQTVHLAAPGSIIYSTYHLADDAYEVMNGTSMAAPHVAGALGLLRAHFPTETYRQSINRILNAADRLPALTGTSMTQGRLNLLGALQGVTNSMPNPRAVKLALLPGHSPGQMRLRITGQPGQICGVDRSTDLASTNWTRLPAIRLPANGIADMAVNSAATPRAYFRVRSN